MIFSLDSIVYIVLIINIIGDYYSMTKLPSWFAPIYKPLQVIAWPLKRPFQGIFKTKMDISSIAALFIYYYVVSPVLRTLI